MLPTLALSGFVTGGNQVLRAAAGPARDLAHMTDAMIAQVNRLAAIGWSLHAALVLLPFAARGVRHYLERRHRPPLLTHANGRTVTLLAGATVLETLREHGIPHAAVCGGRARCTTCRVEFISGEPERSTVAERTRLAEKGLTGVRLSCQILCDHDMAVRAISRLAGSGRPDPGPTPQPFIEPPPEY
jgi:ferredoxin